jgi:hypothetical protein
MNRERAETYLRRLAEAELRRARTVPAAGIPRQRDTARLELVAQALVAVDAVDADTAGQIQADLEVAIAVRQPGQARPGQRGRPEEARMRLARLMHVASRRAGAVALPGSGLARPAPHRASWRIVPVGQVIPVWDGDVRRELLLVAYLQSADGARFTVAGWPFRPLAAVDDRGASYQVGFRGGHSAAELVLRPDPPRDIRWLDLISAPGQPAARIDLDPQLPAPDVAVARKARSPGELLLDVIAARILCSGVTVPQDDLEQLPVGTADLRAFIGDGPGAIVAALRACGALPAASTVPGQLAGLCNRAGIPGHGITAPPADELPERWHSMLTRPRRRPVPQAEAGAGFMPDFTGGFTVATVAELPELDGARITILGLHHGGARTIVHMLVSGVTQEADWTYGRVVRPLPALWARDSSGRWHATRTNGTGPRGNSSEVIVWLEIVPPLDSGTAWIDVVATGRSAEVRVRLPVHPEPAPA